MSDDIEILEQKPLVDASVVGMVTRAEIEQLIDVAHKYPRSVDAAIKAMKSLSCYDEESATECVYSLPRDGKTVIGPSVRFAEMASQVWRNNRVAARITAVDRVEKYVEAEGFFLDAEANVAQLARVRRRISGKSGRLFSDDMITVTGNAACSIAKRNAILSGIPKMAWRPAFNGALSILRGNPNTLKEHRQKTLESIGQFGLKGEQIFQIMGVGGIEDIDVDRLVHMRGLYSALAGGETTADELLRAIEPEKQERATPQTAKMAAPDVFNDADLPSPTKAAAKKDQGKTTAASALPYRISRRR